jgi:hypothetical protein
MQFFKRTATLDRDSFEILRQIFKRDKKHCLIPPPDVFNSLPVTNKYPTQGEIVVSAPDF